ncbi:phosphate-starvation-inducible PsiE family protein [Methanoregula sp.]|uniref:phosphate-starvation-inducible PsiE family protein n=1 Tax=Methanoregula sp. TaxID=2052170 RepID=UPI002CCCCF43|nr:phosphate-starvation-inducible PsiE family protein [Methanoregula sp.]HVP96022.1 phosphate-starvation-inducible PsiE family protein [Methanoregula sp.]
MLDEINKFERIVYTVLIILLGAVLICAIAELVAMIVSYLFIPSLNLLDSREIVAVLGAFLLVLITVELLDTMKAYIAENVIHVEIVVLLAIIAIARKVILLDPASTDSGELIGIGIIIVGLAAAYYLIKQAGVVIGSGKDRKTVDIPQEKS